MILRPVLTLVAVALTLAGCGGKDHGHEHPHPPAKKEGGKPAAAEPTTTNRIPIPATVRANLGITFAKIEHRRVAATKRYPGRFEADADARREYRSPVAGIVEVLVKPYEAIAIGMPVARVSGRGWADLQREWLESRTTGTSAEGALAEALAKRKTLLTAQVAAAAGVAVDDPRLEALATAPALTIHAQRAGIVEPQVAITGTRVEDGAALIATLDPTRVRLRASAPQGDLTLFTGTKPARIVPSVDTWKTALPARIALGLEADPALRTQDVVAWPQPTEGTPLPPWARPGVGALLEIETASGEGELSIPVAATIRDGLDTIIFRRDPADADKVIRLVADLGINDGTWVEVLSGVAKDDQVVVEGIYQLKLSGAGKAQLGGHFHSDGSFHAEADGEEK
jgi:hypothetical protein